MAMIAVATTLMAVTMTAVAVTMTPLAVVLAVGLNRMTNIYLRSTRARRHRSGLGLGRDPCPHMPVVSPPCMPYGQVAQEHPRARLPAHPSG